MTDRRRNGFILLLVAGLLAASLAVIALKPARLGLDLKGGVELVYQGEPTQQVPTVTPEALDRALDIIRSRVDQLGVGEPEIQRSGRDQISVGLPDVQNIRRAQEQVGTPAQLYFYDWERNALTPNGRTVAPQLPAQDPDAQRISQAAGNSGQGQTLFDAVKLASRQDPIANTKNGSRLGSAYYLFDRQHGYLAGPERSREDLLSALDRTSMPPGSEVLAVPQGYVVLQAAAQSADDQVPIDDATARFYVLRDRVALSGKDIKDPQQGFNETQQPDVEFRFTNDGKNAFHDVTREISQRGTELRLPGVDPTAVLQHFAVALDGRLISVASIDPQQLPDGIDGENGAVIEGGFTIQSAQDLANLIQLGALPIGLKLISQSQVSATLGKQALNEGLVAGAVGLIVVALFLIAFYRMLGVIATGTLVIYGIYLFALIKLVPITMTLPGIAGLILTIGVAADANIVIFERVKEELRAGKSVPSAISTGYRKGLTAIVDANVVTVMTAFILFMLATAGVKGFAFMLGVGTLVSLFTAVMATQAILATLGRTRMFANPAAVGAHLAGARWRFDFMGASKWFFSMSGVILLIGALAIGGKGLNFGIDFTSGTRITTALAQPASEGDLRTLLEDNGVDDAKIQRVDNKDLGANVVQISTEQLQPTAVQRLEVETRSDLRRHIELLQHLGRADLRPDGREQRDRRDHRLAARDLGLHRAALPMEVRRPGADRADARPADHRRHLLAPGPGGDVGDDRGPVDHSRLLALRHDHRVRPHPREHAADAAGGVLADRQPLDVRGPDAFARDVVVYGSADPRADAVRRRDAARLRVRAACRRDLRRLLVDLHRDPGADALEGARAGLRGAPRADRGRARRPRAGLCDRRRGRTGRRRAGGESAATAPAPHDARGPRAGAVRRGVRGVAPGPRRR